MQTPTRVLDTRTTTGGHFGKVGSGETVRLQVPGGTTVMALNMVALNASREGYLTVYAAGWPNRPGASNLNYHAGRATTNMVITNADASGTILIYNSGSPVDIVADLTATYGWKDGLIGSGFVEMYPRRVLDTRTSGGPLEPTTTRTLGSMGLEPVASGVVLNVTATQGTTTGYAVAYPAATTKPNSSSLNWMANETVANMVMGRLGESASINLYNNSGSVHLIADITGYFTG